MQRLVTQTVNSALDLTQVKKKTYKNKSTRRMQTSATGAQSGLLPIWILMDFSWIQTVIQITPNI